MEEILQEDQEMESNTISKTDQLKIELSLKECSVSELIETLQSLKLETKELLSQRKELQQTESDLRNQATTEVDDKKRLVAGLKTEIAFLQKKCEELEQALGTPY